MTDQIEWVDPPTSKGGVAPAFDHRAFAAALRANPGKWAKVPRDFATPATASSVAASIKGGRAKAFAPAGAFAAVGRTVGGKPVVYACFTGQP